MLAVPLTLIPPVITMIWLFSIRPYCHRHRKGYTPGANIAVTFWVDWQEAREIAKDQGDNRMLFICRLVFWLQVAGLCFLALLICLPRPH